jgi:hypothetical protein
VGLVILIMLLILVVGGLPVWPFNRGMGYGPSGLLGLILVVVLILVLMGRI